MTDVETVALEGSWWTARVRYGHEFDDSETVQEVDVSDVAQGATARVRGGRVEFVRVPDGAYRDESDVEAIAEKATETIECE